MDAKNMKGMHAATTATAATLAPAANDANDAKVSKLLHQVQAAKLAKIFESVSVSVGGISPAFFNRIFAVLIKIVENLRNGFDKAPHSNNINNNNNSCSNMSQRRCDE